MIAQILNIELNATKEGAGGKSYSGLAVTYQPPEYKGKVKDPSTRFMFGNSDVVKQFKSSGLEVGDWADIKFDESKWKNPESFTKTGAPAQDGGGANAAPKPKNVSTNITVDQSVWDAKDKRIARAVAIKEATQLVALMAGNGGYTTTNIKKREFLVEEMLATAKALEPYLTLAETPEEVMKDLYPEGVEGDLPQPPFNE
jgi:hypothetical protein